MRTTCGPNALKTVAAALLVSGLAACGATTPSTTGPTVVSGSQLSGALPASILNMPFTDTNGHTVRLRDFKGKTIVLQDILTLCQEHCPIDTAAFVLTAHQYAATAPDPSNVVFLSITVDPARDTPAQLGAYKSLYTGGTPSALPQWHLLTGSAADLTAVWKYFHVYVQKVPEDPGAVVRNWRTGQRLTFDIDHSDNVYFIDATGQQRFVLTGQPYLSNGTIPPTLNSFMSSGGHANEQTGQWTYHDALSVLAWLTKNPA